MAGQGHERPRSAGCRALFLASQLAIASTACSPPANAPDRTVLLSPGALAQTEIPVPSDRDGILAELAPLPASTIVIVYQATGPAGLHGTLESIATVGGFERQNWNLSLTLPDGVRAITGSVVRTPDELWRASGDDVGQVEAAPLGTVADAILRRSIEQRERIVAEIRAWRLELEQARDEAPGQRERIAGIECLRVRVGGGEVCTWEQARMPLRYGGSVFSLRATHVSTGDSIGASAFEIPPLAERLPARVRADLDQRLTRVADGDRAELVRLLERDTVLRAPASTEPQPSP